MGTHGKGPSIVVAEDSKPLKDWIQANPDCLGDKVRSKFNAQLPFLFKVLSVNKALSIQAHPHKVRLACRGRLIKNTGLKLLCPV